MIEQQYEINTSSFALTIQRKVSPIICIIAIPLLPFILRFHYVETKIIALILFEPYLLWYFFFIRKYTSEAKNFSIKYDGIYIEEDKQHIPWEKVTNFKFRNLFIQTFEIIYINELNEVCTLKGFQKTYFNPFKFGNFFKHIKQKYPNIIWGKGKANKKK